MIYALIAVPLAAALVLALVRDRRIGFGLALVAALATFVAAILLDPTARISYTWIAGIGATFTLDAGGAASVLVLTAALAMIPAVIWSGLRVEQGSNRFLALLLAMHAAINGIFLAKDLLLFYVFWDAALVPSLLMLAGWGMAKRREATQKYLVYALAGSFLMLLSILALRPLSGALSYRLDHLLAVTPDLALNTQLWLFAGFTVAFAVKLPMLPLHSWLIDFHRENHPSGAADLAGSLYKVGAFGFFAWAIPLLPDAALAFAPILMALAAATALYAAIAATRQEDLKSLLAYASLSHMGIAGVGVFALQLNGSAGAMYLFAAQMLTTGGLFLIAGMLHARTGTFELSEYGGLARTAPALAGVSLFVIFASIGVPGLANFPGEFMSLLGAFQASLVAAVFAVGAVIAAGVYGVNLYQRLYQGRQTHAHRDLLPLESLVLVPILAGILWLGLAPAPQLERISAQPAYGLAAADGRQGPVAVGMETGDDNLVSLALDAPDSGTSLEGR